MTGKNRLSLTISTLILLIGCGVGFDGNSAREGMNYREIVDIDAGFIEKNIRVEPADSKWNWLLPDLNSTAKITSQLYNSPAEAGSFKFVRTFKIYEDIGFVWQWQNNGTTIYLIYTFLGKNGCFIRTLHNIDNITEDEAILAAYFDQEFSANLQQFTNEYWIIKDPAYESTKSIEIESLGFLGEEFFRGNETIGYFAGRIVTFPRSFIKQKSEEYVVCDQFFDDMYQSCLTLPNSFASLLAQYNIPMTKLLDGDILAHLKIKLSQKGTIQEVVAGAFYDFYYCDNSKVYADLPLPPEYIGAGASAMNLVECEAY